MMLLTARETEAIKGFYILCIVIGHNVLITSNIPHLFHVLYNFHVFGFLLLPFIRPRKEFSWSLLKDHAVRYGVPFLVFYLLTSILFFLIEVPHEQRVVWLGNFFVGLLTMGATAMDKASGFQLFWFLPAFFSLIVAISLYERCSYPWRYVALVIVFIAHSLVGLLPDMARYYFPLGIPIVGFTFLLGLGTALLWNHLSRAALSLIRVPGLIVSIILSWVSVSLNSSVNIAVIKVYTLFDPLNMVLHDILILTTFFTITAAVHWLSKSSLLVLLGRHSLGIYLVHSLIFQALLRGYIGLNLADSAFWRWSFMIVSLIGVLMTSLAVSKKIDQLIIVRKTLFPKSRNDWAFMPRAGD